MFFYLFPSLYSIYRSILSQTSQHSREDRFRLIASGPIKFKSTVHTLCSCHISAKLKPRLPQRTSNKKVSDLCLHHHLHRRSWANVSPHQDLPCSSRQSIMNSHQEINDVLVLKGTTGLDLCQFTLLLLILLSSPLYPEENSTWTAFQQINITTRSIRITVSLKGCLGRGTVVLFKNFDFLGFKILFFWCFDSFLHQIQFLGPWGCQLSHLM